MNIHLKTCKKCGKKFDMMSCPYCNKERQCFICGIKENLHESHDIPCYLFIDSGNRQGRKNQADKHGRHLLCKKHHEKYEKELNEFLKTTAKKFALRYYNG